MFLIGNGWMRVVLSYNGMPVGYRMEQEFKEIDLLGLSMVMYCCTWGDEGRRAEKKHDRRNTLQSLSELHVH